MRTVRPRPPAFLAASAREVGERSSTLAHRGRVPPHPESDRPIDDSAVMAGFVAGRLASHRVVDTWIGEVLRRFPLGPDQDDVAQEVRRKLLESFRAQRFDGRASLRTYVWKAAQRAAIDHGRARRRRGTRVSLEDAPEPLAAPDVDPVEAEERRALFAHVMSSMGEGCQRLWALIVFEELGYAEIARRLGTSEGAVKLRAWRCRAEASRLCRQRVTGEAGERPYTTTAG